MSQTLQGTLVLVLEGRASKLSAVEEEEEWKCIRKLRDCGVEGGLGAEIGEPRRLMIGI